MALIVDVTLGLVLLAVPELEPFPDYCLGGKVYYLDFVRVLLQLLVLLLLQLQNAKLESVHSLA